MGRTRGLAQRGLAARRCWLVALLLPMVPWTVRNAIVLDRIVPLSTGGGKALYVGTYLPADGDYQRVKATLVERYQAATRTRLRGPGRVDPVPLFDRVADPLPRPAARQALGKIGKENLSDYIAEHPLDYRR